MEPGGLIFTENFEGKLVPMRPAAPASEDDLQDLIARFPDVVSAEEGELLLVRREQGVPDVLSGYDRWSLDHLFVSRSAVPVLVEVKRASDTRIRREVVGQLLDYAANGVVYWPAGALATSFVETCIANGTDPESVLRVFLGDQDPVDFWSQVQANLIAGRLRLLVVADVIPPELARVIEFLNDQMRAEVRAVELRYFLGADGRRTLAPRFIGETEKSRVTKGAGSNIRPPPIGVEEWLETKLRAFGDAAIAGARVHLDIMGRLGAEISVASTHGSVRAAFVAEDGTKVRPLDLFSDARISIGFTNIKKRSRLVDPIARRTVLEKMARAVGGMPSANLDGFPSFPVSRLIDPELASAYEREASDLVALARAT